MRLARIMLWLFVCIVVGTAIPFALSLLPDAPMIGMERGQ